jgi:hypothetical protein
VKVQRRTEGGDAPGWQGRDEREYREYLNEEQRSQPGCSAGRMQLEFHHGLLGFDLCSRKHHVHGRRYIARPPGKSMACRIGAGETARRAVCYSSWVLRLFVSSWLHLHFRVAAVIIVAIAALAVAFPRSGRVIIVCDD